MSDIQETLHIFPNNYPDTDVITYRRADLVDAEITRLTAERDEAIKEVGRWARKFGLLEAERDALKRLRQMHCDLLAVIHRDGGHYIYEHGIEKANADAQTIVLAERQQGEDNILDNVMQMLKAGCPVDHSTVPLDSFRGCIICERQRADALKAEVERLEQCVYAADASVADLTVLLAAERQRARLPEELIGRIIYERQEFNPHFGAGKLLGDILAAVEEK